MSASVILTDQSCRPITWRKQNCPAGFEYLLRVNL